ncbi:hypothetical protein DCAR_0936207 [Daucus carota subsp. sativus]|uniref:Uncharacterized protein n=1 Tax=Daucus carota subsp. sativus TaxID=79200 RepID=A0A175YJA3_DAUCS|nr:hypothetical protein DCAR_0936207 [Daucus carota subsp. sativus]
MRENLSKGIKSAIDQVIYHILCYEDDCDLSQYEVYVRHDEHKLIEYKLTMGEIVDEARDELESLEKKYEIVLGEEIINMQMKKKLVHLKFKHYIFGEWKVVKGDEITRESGCVDDINIEIEDPFDDVKEVEDKEVGEDRVLETRPQNDYFQIVEEYKVVGDLIEVDHIERSYNVDLPHNKIPDLLSELAKKMAAPSMSLGEEFQPEAAIVNYFGAGDMLGGHLDDMEADWSKPIVSMSLGCKAIFLLGGKSREDEPIAMFLRSGDIVLMAGEVRECFHGIVVLFFVFLFSAFSSY